jgi:hypothetical protein
MITTLLIWWEDDSQSRPCLFKGHAEEDKAQPRNVSVRLGAARLKFPSRGAAQFQLPA